MKSKAEAQARLQAQQQVGLNGGESGNVSVGGGVVGNGGKNGGAVSLKSTFHHFSLSLFPFSFLPFFSFLVKKRDT